MVQKLRGVKIVSGFREARSDGFNPEYGDVIWKRRLNNRLEQAGVEMFPVEYDDGIHGPMQITQENTIVFINQTADEMDCIAMNYPPETGQQLWFFREGFIERDTSIEEVVRYMGGWALQTMTLYPMENVVQTYESLYGVDVPDSLPDGFC
jgi:hypothetical protein